MQIRSMFARVWHMPLSLSFSALIHSPKSVLSSVTISSVDILVTSSAKELYTLWTTSWSVCVAAGISGATGGIVMLDSSTSALASVSVNACCRRRVLSAMPGILRSFRASHVTAREHWVPPVT